MKKPVSFRRHKAPSQHLFGYFLLSVPGNSSHQSIKAIRSRKPLSSLLPTSPLNSTHGISRHPSWVPNAGKVNTYQFVWARDTHTFSCHHNTEPTTSTTRADSSSDSSTGPLKARQRCILEEAGEEEAGRGGGGGARSGSSLVKGAGLGGGGRGRMEKGVGTRRKPNKPTHPAGKAEPQPKAAGAQM